MTVTKKSLSVLVLCTFGTLLAALKVCGMGDRVWCDARWMPKQGNGILRRSAWHGSIYTQHNQTHLLRICLK